MQKKGMDDCLKKCINRHLCIIQNCLLYTFREIKKRCLFSVNYGQGGKKAPFDDKIKVGFNPPFDF